MITDLLFSSWFVILVCFFEAFHLSLVQGQVHLNVSDYYQGMCGSLTASVQDYLILHNHHKGKYLNDNLSLHNAAMLLELGTLEDGKLSQVFSIGHYVFCSFPSVWISTFCVAHTNQEMQPSNVNKWEDLYDSGKLSHDIAGM